MTPRKADLLDSFVSPKVLFGPSASEASRAAREALRADARYDRLRKRLGEVGFFEPAPIGYAWRIGLILGLFAAGFAGLLSAPGWPVRVLCWAVIGFALVQGGFVSHEATHSAISKRPWVAQAVGQVLQTLLVGIAFSHFWRSHELHHHHCNEPDVDPDTQSSLWSLTEGSERDKGRVGRFATRFQHVFLVIVTPIWGHQLKLDSWIYVARNLRKTRIDQIMGALHLGLWFGVMPAFVGLADAAIDYVGWLAAASIYMMTVIPINHVGKPVFTDPNAPFLDQQIAATRNLGSSPLMDFFFMGQNSHIEHHLFPSVPCSRLARGRRVVREFCREEGLPYREYGFFEALTEVWSHFAKIGSRVKDPGVAFPEKGKLA